MWDVIHDDPAIGLGHIHLKDTPAIREEPTFDEGVKVIYGPGTGAKPTLSASIGRKRSFGSRELTLDKLRQLDIGLQKIEGDNGVGVKETLDQELGRPTWTQVPSRTTLTGTTFPSSLGTLDLNRPAVLNPSGGPSSPVPGTPRERMPRRLSSHSVDSFSAAQNSPSAVHRSHVPIPQGEKGEQGQEGYGWNSYPVSPFPHTPADITAATTAATSPVASRNRRDSAPDLRSDNLGSSPAEKTFEDSTVKLALSGDKMSEIAVEKSKGEQERNFLLPPSVGLNVSLSQWQTMQKQQIQIMDALKSLTKTVDGLQSAQGLVLDDLYKLKNQGIVDNEEEIYEEVLDVGILRCSFIVYLCSSVRGRALISAQIYSMPG